MYIITQQGSTIGHKIGAITLGEANIQVTVESQSLEPQPTPGGTSISNWSNQITLPLIDLGADYKLAVANFLVSPGQPFEGGTIVSDEEFAFTAKRLDLLMKVKKKRDAYELGGVVTPFGSVIQTDADSQRKISGATLDALIAKINVEEWTETWRMADDTFTTVTADDMIGVGRLVKNHVAACQRHKDVLDAQINAALTIEDLEAIEVNVGWPGQPEPEPEPVPEPVVEPAP